ncbi:formimidoylglutamate deiminase [Galbitalea soli]|uniref:Formimidoylglutamate deiminase n=1 Tax=Galbitalea soli TaxID=1268042 RepID=A0A7C9TQT1_9MICO|nr:formimidoylglutamate deiminase [Galbitalea soli]NEM90960.1 formimidoylglutamate deiminase [Galbitalea soli]
MADDPGGPDRAGGGARLARGVRLDVDAAGIIRSVSENTLPASGDTLLGHVVPGFANGHSHLFHRALRGRTHDAGGDFWSWRDRMYGVAAALDPERYHALAVAVFAEMLAAGYTAVGEFHYLHHRPDGSAYPHEMELAVDAAAREVGIRLTLLDTAYLAGGIGLPLAPAQRRFGDGGAKAYLERWYALREFLPRLGAAVHSVRAVPPEALGMIAAGLPPEVPLHVHLSEQPRENDDTRRAYGVSPTRLLHERGLLTPRLSVVHATHLDDDDLALLGDAGVTVVMCPTTEADLGDGIGPARALADAGCPLAIGSDQNATVDPLLELRALELQERLRALARGRFTPAELLTAGTSAGYRALGIPGGTIAVGSPCDLVELDAASVRTVGADPAQLVLAATSADVRRVIVGGRVVAGAGILADGRDPARLLATALEDLG